MALQEAALAGMPVKEGGGERQNGHVAVGSNAFGEKTRRGEYFFIQLFSLSTCPRYKTTVVLR